MKTYEVTVKQQVERTFAIDASDTKEAEVIAVHRFKNGNQAGMYSIEQIYSIKAEAHEID